MDLMNWMIDLDLETICSYQITSNFQEAQIVL